MKDFGWCFVIVLGAFILGVIAGAKAQKDIISEDCGNFGAASINGKVYECGERSQ